jgi:hypothetical protein
VPADLPEALGEVLAGYVTALASAPLSAQSRRTYASKVRQYLVWLASAEVTAIRSATPPGVTGQYATTAAISRRC